MEKLCRGRVSRPDFFRIKVCCAAGKYALLRSARSLCRGAQCAPVGQRFWCGSTGFVGANVT
ncbi:MAG: hypothetical protein ACI4J6_05740 [Oscillospiraceae bacterium]